MLFGVETFVAHRSVLERERAAGGRLPPSYGSDGKKTNKKHVPFLASDEQHEPGKNTPTLQVCQSVQKGRKR